jgi:hypothetical protein
MTKRVNNKKLSRATQETLQKDKLTPKILSQILADCNKGVLSIETVDEFMSQLNNLTLYKKIQIQHLRNFNS